jgi:hypothetical protein
MSEKNYEALLKQLHDGELDEFVVTPPEFMEFQKVFQASPYRSQIEGNAKHGGEIHYHLIKEEQE